MYGLPSQNNALNPRVVFQRVMSVGERKMRSGEEKKVA